MIKALNGTQVTFCKRKSCCPTITVVEDGFLIGGEQEGFSKFSKTNLEDFISAAKEGKFDHLIQ